MAVASKSDAAQTTLVAPASGLPAVQSGADINATCATHLPDNPVAISHHWRAFPRFFCGASAFMQACIRTVRMLARRLRAVVKILRAVVNKTRALLANLRASAQSIFAVAPVLRAVAGMLAALVKTVRATVGVLRATARRLRAVVKIVRAVGFCLQVGRWF